MSIDETIQEEILASGLVSPSYFRIFVGAIDGQGHLVYKDQVNENGPFADNFTQLTDNTYKPATLRAALTMEGYVSLIAEATGTQSLLYLAESPGSEATNRFRKPVDLGKPSSVSAFQDTVLLRGLNGLSNVFGLGADDTIWWKYKNSYTVGQETVTTIPPGTETPIEVTVAVAKPPTQPWSDWQQLPGALKTVRATNNADGRIILVGLNEAQVPYLNFQSSDRPFLPEGWEGWQDIQGSLSGFEQIEIAIDGDGFVYIFGRIGANIYKKVQTEMSGNVFTDWLLFAAFDLPIQTFAVGASSNDGLYLAAQVGSGAGSPIYGIRQTTGAHSAWTTPTVIAYAPGNLELNLYGEADQKLILFALDTESRELSYILQQLPDHWSANWTGLGSFVADFTVTHDITPTGA
ncbi:hypothetical protein [Roseibium sp.]|uniref:hypothetical protein n=1 Tax=Roseibium sp. TaxID=1936156 RepID=UPI003A96B283